MAYVKEKVNACVIYGNTWTLSLTNLWRYQQNVSRDSNHIVKFGNSGVSVREVITSIL